MVCRRCPSRPTIPHTLFLCESTFVRTLLKVVTCVTKDTIFDSRDDPLFYKCRSDRSHYGGPVGRGLRGNNGRFLPGIPFSVEWNTSLGSGVPFRTHLVRFPVGPILLGRVRSTRSSDLRKGSKGLHREKCTG